MTSTLYRSGHVYAPGSPRATAVLVDADAGEIVWVGTDEAARRLGKPDAVVDLDGRLMAPAFVDAWVRSVEPEMRLRAAAAGIGSMHVVVAATQDETTDRDVPEDGPGADLVAVPGLGVADDDAHALTERYVRQVAGGHQAAAVAETPAQLRSVLAAAGAAATRVGTSRFVAARHRLHLAGEALALDPTSIERLAALGLVVCLAPGGVTGPGLPLRALASGGVPFTFGSAGGYGRADPWTWVRAASASRPGHSAVSARAAFAAATRGGRRAAREDGAGELRPGASAELAVWQYEGDLVVRTPDYRVAAWSTDPRAATPGLPDLDVATAPRCSRTIVRGRVVFDDGTLG